MNKDFEDICYQINFYAKNGCKAELIKLLKIVGEIKTIKIYCFWTAQIFAWEGEEGAVDLLKKVGVPIDKLADTLMLQITQLVEEQGIYAAEKAISKVNMERYAQIKSINERLIPDAKKNEDDLVKILTGMRDIELPKKFDLLKLTNLDMFRLLKTVLTEKLALLINQLPSPDHLTSKTKTQPYMNTRSKRERTDSELPTSNKAPKSLPVFSTSFFINSGPELLPKSENSNPKVSKHSVDFICGKKSIPSEIKVQRSHQPRWY